MNRVFASYIGQELSFKGYLDMLKYAKDIGSFGWNSLYYYYNIRGMTINLLVDYEIKADGSISMFQRHVNHPYHALFSNSGKFLKTTLAFLLLSADEETLRKITFDRLKSSGVELDMVWDNHPWAEIDFGKNQVVTRVEVRKVNKFSFKGKVIKRKFFFYHLTLKSSSPNEASSTEPVITVEGIQLGKNLNKTNPGGHNL